LPNAEFVCVPPDVWEGRIGYVVIQISKSLREATLLGFVKQVTSLEVPLTEIRSLQELPRYLNKSRSVLNLSQWFEGIFEASWQAVEAFLDTQPTELAFNYRSAPTTKVRRCKLIELGTSEQSVLMSVELTEADEQEMEISLEVQPTKGQTYLPTNLQLMLLNEEGEAIDNVQVESDNQTIELQFAGEVGDRFSVNLVLGDVSFTENFII
jgi:hypothetical protein